MKRFIKVNGEWIDTQYQHDEWGRYYRLEPSENDETKVYYYSDEYGVDYYVGILEDQSDEPQEKHIVRFVVYTRFMGMFPDEEELEEEEETEYTCDTYEKAEKIANKNKVGWRGSYVEVYIDDEYYRDYEVR